MASIGLRFTSCCAIPVRAKISDNNSKNNNIAGVSPFPSRASAFPSGPLISRDDSGVHHLGRLSVKAAEGTNTPATKPNSIICADCDGNGAKACTQCNGSGVNAVDHFNGQFKAGGLCWLCRGKKEILCGNCNGAGFIGGFMSTFDE